MPSDSSLHFDALEQLANSVRCLIAATVTVHAPPEVLVAAAEAVDLTVADLQRHVTDPPPPRYPADVDPTNPSSVFPYDVVMGRCNPLAPPIDIRWEDQKAIGSVRFGTPHEGPPGCVHGAVLAASFDQMFTVANLMSGVAGPTAQLQLQYRRPTPLFTDLRFEAWVDHVEERKVHSTGRLLAGDIVTVEAAGLFVRLSRDRVMRMRDG